MKYYLLILSILLLQCHRTYAGDNEVWRWNENVFAVLKDDGLYLNENNIEHRVLNIHKGVLVFNIAPNSTGVFLTTIDQGKKTCHYKISLVDSAHVEEISGHNNNSQYYADSRNVLTTIRRDKSAILMLNGNVIDSSIIYQEIEISSDGKYCISVDANMRLRISSVDSPKTAIQLTVVDFSGWYCYLNDIVYYAKNEKNSEGKETTRIVAYDLKKKCYCCENETIGKSKIPKVYYMNNTIVW